MKKILIIFSGLLFISIIAVAQYNMPVAGSVNYTICSGTFYDDGGANGNYSDKQNATITFYPNDTTKQKLSVAFSSFSTDETDVLKVYNGSSTAASSQIANLSGEIASGTIISTAENGSLTFHFSTASTWNNLVGTGWAATITCVDPLSIPPSRDITMMSSGIYRICSGNFYDIGGASGNYINNQSTTVTIYPEDTINRKLSISFASFSTDETDVLKVYNGKSTAANQIANLSGEIASGTIISTADNGSLTFHFSTASTWNNLVGTGWAATITCVDPLSIPASGDITMMSSGIYKTCSANFYDIGGASGDYIENQNATVTIYPDDTINQKLSISFSSFSTAVVDFLKVYDGNSIAAPQIDNLSGNIALRTFISTAANGSLTLRFNSSSTDGYFVSTGWAATISCVGSGCTPPSTPTGFTATAISSSQIALSWNPVQDAIGYDIYYCDGTYTAFTSNTSYNHTGRVPSTTYSYKIAAQKSATCVSPQTSCVNATTFNSPATSMISFYNKIDNNLHFIFPKLMVSASTNNITTPFKVCADGSQATFIEYQNNDPSVTTGNIYFRIKEDIAGVQTSIYGSFSGTFNVSSNIRKVYFNHPTYMNLTGKFRAANIQVIDASNGNAILATYPMEIYRAPIVFVHGFEGDNTTFENLRDNLISDNLYPLNSFEIRTTDFNGAYTSNGLIYTCAGNCIVNETVIYNPLLHLIDYRKTNGKSFSVNAKNNTIVNGIDSVFKTARSNNYSSGNVILIGHSMGGILSRLYLQSTYQNSINYRSDIQKLITINTPHYGTQFSNYVLNPLNIPLLSLVAFANVKLSDKKDALNDLKVNSFEITKNLNIKVSSQNKVPSNTISTYVTNPFSLIEDKAFAITVYSITNPIIFNNENSDLIVPLSSQKGGFNWASSDNNRFHMGSTRSDFVQDDVKVLINSSPFNSNFSTTGFVQDTLKYNYRNSKSNQAARTLSDSIEILNIADGQSFNLGDSINVSFSNTSGISRIKVFLTGGANTIFVGSTTTSNSSIKFKIDSAEVGSRWIYLLGFDSLNFVDWDSVGISLNTSVQLDSIKISPRNINLPLGYSETFFINGYYRDGIIRGLKNASGLTLAFDTSKIAVDSDYKVTGKKGPFKILLTADYLNKRDTILVETTANNSTNIADYSSDRNIICTGSQINYSDASLGIVQSRSWQFPGGSPFSSNSQSPTVTYNSPGTYNVTLIVTYSGKTDTISRSNYITVNPIPSTPTITMGTATTFCNGGSVTLTSNAATGNQWYKDGAAIGDSTSTTLNVTASGSYTVKVTMNSCESAASNAIVVTVNPFPATPTITQNVNQLVSSATSGNQWYFNDAIIAIATGQNYTPTASGNYTVQVTVNNCTSAFSGAFAYIFTSIPNIDVYGSLVKVLPNPVDDKLIIMRSNPVSVLNIQLFDINGRQLKIFTSSLSRTEIDMTKYAAGLYIVRIEDKRNKILGKKVIVKLK